MKGEMGKQKGGKNKVYREREREEGKITIKMSEKVICNHIIYLPKFAYNTYMSVDILIHIQPK